MKYTLIVVGALIVTASIAMAETVGFFAAGLLGMAGSFLIGGAIGWTDTPRTPRSKEDQ